MKKGKCKVAIFHLSASIVSRAKGMSAIAKSSYNSCDKIKNEYDGKVHNYSKKGEHTYHEILLCKNAPLEYQDKAKLWNSVELSEKSKNAQLCRSFDIALPKELNQEEQEKLIHDFCKENFSDKGMCVQIDIHSNENNPHAHVMTTLRGIDENGKWIAKRKDVYKLDENKERIPIIDKKTGLQKVDSRNRKQWERETIKTNDWDSKEKIYEWRKSWADKTNEHLKIKFEKQKAEIEKSGASKEEIDKMKLSQITHLSHEEDGRKMLPQIHLGSYNHKLMKEGKTNPRIEKYLNIMEINNKIREIYKNFQKQIREIPKRQNTEMLMMAKENEERAKMSVNQIKNQIEDNLLLIDVKKAELKELDGKWFKGKEKAELNKEIDDLKSENYKLEKTLKQKQSNHAIAKHNVQIQEDFLKPKEISQERLEQVKNLEKQMEIAKPDDLEIQKRAEERRKRLDDLDLGIGIKAKPKAHNDMSKGAKRVDKVFDSNKQHDVGNPLEKSTKQKIKDTKTHDEEIVRRR